MPYIPLPESNLEPPMPQVQALVPQAGLRVDARGLFNAVANLGEASKLPMIDAEPFVAAAGAKDRAIGEVLSSKAMAGAIGTLGQAVVGAVRKAGSEEGALAMKRQEARDDRTTQRVKRAFAAERERSAQFRQATPDTARWVPDTQKGIAAVMKKVTDAKGISPQTLRLLSVMGQKEMRDQSVLTEAAVAKAEFAETAEVYRSNHISAVATKNYGAAAELAKDGGQKGYFSQEEADVMLKVVAEHEREDALWRYIAEHPREAPDQFMREDRLTEFNLTSKERREWTHRSLAAREHVEHQSLEKAVGSLMRGEVSELPDLEGWKNELAPEAYASLSTLLASHASSTSMNSDAGMEQTIAAIENLKSGNDPDALLAKAGVGLRIIKQFSGTRRNDLQGRLARRLERNDTNEPSPLGPALEQLNQWAFHDKLGGLMETPSASHRVTAEVRALREQLEVAHTSGKITNDEDALDFVAMKVINGGWGLSKREEGAIA
jgi:hypothetical protein